MSQPLPVTAAIVAGGKSRRMGKDKAWIEFGGRPLIRHVVDRLTSAFSDVVICANDPTYDSLGLARIPDRLASRGPMSGIHSALSAMQTDWCFVCGCDMPFLSVPLVRHLLKNHTGQSIVAPTSSRGIEPLHALYSKDSLSELEARAKQGLWKLTDFCSPPRAQIVEVKEEEWLVEGRSPFFNVNDEDDLKNLSD